MSREHLLRLGATVAERATERRVRVLAQLLLVAALVFVALKVRSIWHGGHLELATVDWAALAGSFVLAAVGTAAGALIWLVILDGLGVRSRGGDGPASSSRRSSGSTSRARSGNTPVGRRRARDTGSRSDRS